MATIAEQKDAVARWKQLTKIIQDGTFVDNGEDKATQISRITHLRKDYEAFFAYYFPHHCTDKSGEVVPSAPFHISAAKEIRDNDNLFAVYQWARGHAKSTHLGMGIPMWLKCQEKRTINNMILVGKSEDSSCKLLGDLQAELQYNKRYIRDFGLQYSSGKWTDGAFTTVDGCSFTALGRGQSPRGLKERGVRPDYIVVDDIDDDELCENEKRVHKVVDWIREALMGCFGAEGGRFIMVGNLIHKNSVLANISKMEIIKVSRVNIIDKKGNPSWAFWKPEMIEYLQKRGYRPFQKEYMNNPITEGAVFRNNWIKYKKLPKLTQYEQLIAYCDPSFKSSSKNDYKAIKLWGKIGNELHHIDSFVRQSSVSEMVRWFYDLHERIPEGVICDYYIESNFLQDIILDEFTVEGDIRGYQLPIRGDKRKKPDKFQRIEAISPLWERGFVYYNLDKQNDPDMLAGIEQTLAIEKGSRAHDDAPDADEGAIYILQKSSRMKDFTPLFGSRQSPKNAW